MSINGAYMWFTFLLCSFQHPCIFYNKQVFLKWEKKIQKENIYYSLTPFSKIKVKICIIFHLKIRELYLRKVKTLVQNYTIKQVAKSSQIPSTPCIEEKIHQMEFTNKAIHYIKKILSQVLSSQGSDLPAPLWQN